MSYHPPVAIPVATPAFPRLLPVPSRKTRSMSDYSVSEVAPEIRLVRHAKNGGGPSIAMLSVSAAGQITSDHSASGSADPKAIDTGFEHEA